jgi:hypothetical protein
VHVEAIIKATACSVTAYGEYAGTLVTLIRWLAHATRSTLLYPAQRKAIISIPNFPSCSTKGADHLVARRHRNGVSVQARLKKRESVTLSIVSLKNLLGVGFGIEDRHLEPVVFVVRPQLRHDFGFSTQIPTENSQEPPSDGGLSVQKPLECLLVDLPELHLAVRHEGCGSSFPLKQAHDSGHLTGLEPCYFHGLASPPLFKDPELSGLDDIHAVDAQHFARK